MYVYCFDGSNYKQIISADLHPAICLQAIPGVYQRNQWWKPCLSGKYCLGHLLPNGLFPNSDYPS